MGMTSRASPDAGRSPESADTNLTSAIVDFRDLAKVGARPTFLDYLVQIWSHRYFIHLDARSRVLSGNSKDKFGLGWLVLTPIMNGLVYYVIFGILLNTSRGIDNFLGYLMIGVFLFQYTASSITTSGKSLQAKKSMIQAFSFPRAIVPISASLQQFLAQIPAILALLILVLVIPPAEPISLMWFLLVPIVLLQFIFNVGLGLIIARIVSRFNDFSNMLSFLTRFWMYGSAVMFSFDRFVSDPAILAIVKLNPLFIVIDMARSVILYERLPTWENWALITLWALAAVILGFVYFWKGEETYGRD